MTVADDCIVIEEIDDDAGAAAPSELLGPLLEWPELMEQVLAQLDPTDCALLAQVGKPLMTVVLANNLPRAGKGGLAALQLKSFVGSVERLAWAKRNGCPWFSKRTCALIVAGGSQEALQWGREHGCEWGATTCARAAGGGRLEELQHMRGSGCSWDATTCASAARGHLAVLVWAREQDCPWGVLTCAEAAAGGHMEVLQWAREHDCPWSELTCAWGC